MRREPQHLVPVEVAVGWDWTQIGVSLVIVTLGYNIAEAVIALWYGAESASVALVGFGLDSVIETAAASVLLWRLLLEARGAPAEVIERTEHRVHRFVGATFLVLALYVTLQSIWTLWGHHVPLESWVGVVLATVSLLLMPLVAWGKLHAADAIGSAALRAEAKETLACCYLSFALLVGLGAHATLGWWWADPIAALLMVPWLIKEGREGLAGEDCCAGEE